MESGNPSVRLLQEQYIKLRAIAAGLMRRQRPDSLLQPTALVNDFCAKVCANGSDVGQDPDEFLSMAAIAMRRMLIDRARSRGSAKRRRPGMKVEIEEIADTYEQRAFNMELLHEAMSRLNEFDPTMAKVVDLRFFGGISMEEIARFMDMPLRTLERRWEVTRAWLKREIE